MLVRDHHGHSTREHLEAAARRGSVSAVAALQGPTIADELWYLFEWLLELDRARQYDMTGPRLLSYTELDAWSRLTDRRLDAHEVQTLLHLDRVFVHVLTRPDKEKGQ